MKTYDDALCPMRLKRMMLKEGKTSRRQTGYGRDLLITIKDVLSPIIRKMLILLATISCLFACILEINAYKDN